MILAMFQARAVTSRMIRFIVKRHLSRGSSSTSIDAGKGSLIESSGDVTTFGVDAKRSHCQHRLQSGQYRYLME
jgi:hypothetical protein